MKKMISTFFVLASILMVSSLQAQTIRYVKAEATGDGSSWENASGDLQAMVDELASLTGDRRVYVAAGTYSRNIDEGNSFIMKEGVNVYGGFPADAKNVTTMEDRTLPTAQTQTNLTILEGGEGLRVLYQSAEFSTLTTWDGFVIRGASIASKHGAGAYLRANGELKNGVIRGNMLSD